MKWVYRKYPLGEEIPFKQVLHNRKLAKYFNRETALAITCVSELLTGAELPEETPVYYDTGLIEYEDFGLDTIVEHCAADGSYVQEMFVEKGMSAISPMTQFKILLNMPLCFVSIENNLTGDNAVTYSSAPALLTHAALADTDGVILIGAGKVNADGAVESGFALVTQVDVLRLGDMYDGKEGIEIFRALHAEGGND